MRHPLADRPDAVDVVAPLIRSDAFQNPIRVTPRSLVAHRRAVYQLARYFRREPGYDVVPYGFEGREDDPDHVAFLRPHPESIAPGDEFRVPYVGATCSRLREDGRALQWVWLHPYFRRQGLLTGARPEPVRAFGTIAVEGPLSTAVRAFLVKPAHPGAVT